MPSITSTSAGRLRLAILFAVLAFAFMYMVRIVSLTLLMAFTGLDIISAFCGGGRQCPNNAGRALRVWSGRRRPTPYSNFEPGYVFFGMLLGRLEIFTLLVVLTPAFWRK